LTFSPLVPAAVTQLPSPPVGPKTLCWEVLWKERMLVQKGAGVFLEFTV